MSDPAAQVLPTAFRNASVPSIDWPLRSMPLRARSLTITLRMLHLLSRHSVNDTPLKRLCSIRTESNRAHFHFHPAGGAKSTSLNSDCFRVTSLNPMPRKTSLSARTPSKTTSFRNPAVMRTSLRELSRKSRPEMCTPWSDDAVQELCCRRARSSIAEALHSRLRSALPSAREILRHFEARSRNSLISLSARDSLSSELASSMDCTSLPGEIRRELNRVERIRFPVTSAS